MDSVRSKRSKLKKWIRDNYQLFLMASPVIIYVFIFKYLPMGGAIIAFKDYRYNLGILGSPWVGFKNFEFFIKSADALRVTWNTLAYNFSFIIFGTIINVFIALVLNEIRNKHAIKFYQTVMFIPHFMSWVVIAFIVYAFTSPAYGMINQVLATFGLDAVNLYTQPKYWPSLIIIIGMWKYIGFGVLINYAVLINIDPSFYEAAAIDGAKKFQTLRYISIPFLVPVILIQFLLSIGRVFYSDFGLFYQVPQNAAMLYDATDVIDTYVFRALMDRGDIGMSSAVGLFQSVVGLVLVLTTNHIVKKLRSESSLF